MYEIPNVIIFMMKRERTIFKNDFNVHQFLLCRIKTALDIVIVIKRYTRKFLILELN